MEIILTESKVMKIISTLSLEELEDKLEYRSAIWNVEKEYSPEGFRLRKIKSPENQKSEGGK